MLADHLTALLSLAWLLWIALVGIGLILERRSPAATLAWLLALLFMPYFGFLVYLLFGPQRLRGRRQVVDQDGAQRSRVAAVIPQAIPLQEAVAKHLQDNQACPGNDDAGFGPPESYAGGPVASITVGEFDTNLCGMELILTVPGNDQLDGKAVWFEYDPSADSWQCSSEIENKFLPTQCRE